MSILLLTLNGAHAQTTNYVLGTTNLLVGPTAGSNSVVLGVIPSTGGWTATETTNWLHLSQENQSGTGSTNVIFSYDENAGTTRTGSINLAGVTINVTQAGSTYIAAPVAVTTLVSSNLVFPRGVAVDSAGNVYFSDDDEHDSRYEIWKWTPTNNAVSTLFSLSVQPCGVAVDSSGNIYTTQLFQNGLTEWTAANSMVTTQFLTGVIEPYRIAVDDSGNVYLSGSGTSTSVIWKWTVASDSVTTLVPEGYIPSCVAVDKAGNVLFTEDTPNATIDEWIATSGVINTLVDSGFFAAFAVAVDGSGNVYIADSGNNAVKEWVAATGVVNTLVSTGLEDPTDLTVDNWGNVYIADSGNSAIKELPVAFVDPTAKSYSCAAGNDNLVVLPAPVDLLAPFAPLINQPSAESWLTIAGITNGVVSFDFATNSGPNRGAGIAVLGEEIPIFQASPPNFLNTTTPTNGVFQFAFSNFQNSSFTVLSTTNVFLPMTDWDIIGTASNIAPNLFEFIAPNPATNSQRFYRVRSP